MYTPLWLENFNPSDHGWLPLLPTPESATWTQWSRNVDGQKYPDLLMLLDTPGSESQTMAGLSLAGGTVAVPDGWTSADLLAYIS